METSASFEARYAPWSYPTRSSSGRMRRHLPRRQKRPDCLRMLAFNKSDFDLGERIVGKNMANLKIDKEISALLVIDPYNDFISEGGKLWDRLKDCCRSK